MKRFKFRLETVLDQRKQIEKRAKTSFAEAMQDLARGQKVLDELEQARTTILAELAERQRSGDFSPEETRMYQDYLHTVAKCLQEQRDYVRELTSTAEAYRLHLVGASKNRKVVDTMRDHAETAHIAAGNRAEQIASDEIALTRYINQRRSATGDT